MDPKTGTFLEYKNLLFSMAYNMLGNVTAAEDIVQDTYLKWKAVPPDSVRHAKAFLVKIVTNLCINALTSARARREAYVGLWLPEPLPDDPSVPSPIESYHALSIGMMVLLERLTPKERAVFLLKEVFTYDYAELADIFDLSPDNCRQVLKRAKDHLGDHSRRFQVDLKAHERLLHNFLRAVREGNAVDLIGMLKADIVLMTDGGGTSRVLNGERVGAFLKPIYGVDNVRKVLLELVPKFFRYMDDFHVEVTSANGLPSVVSYSGDKPVSLVSLEIEDDRIGAIYVQGNPEKLKPFER